MLDKSVPYYHIVMKIDAEAVGRIGGVAVPEGFRFRFFEDGDEKFWAEIETSVLEFETTETAEAYFAKTYLPRREELRRRCLFVCAESGVPVATATAWYAESELGYQASLHWVAVRPQFQGRGLGRAVAAEATRLFASLEPGRDVWLHTQTWSHRAVRMYRDLGFRMMKSRRIALNEVDGICIPPNDYERALGVLQAVCEPDVVRALRADAR